MASNPGSENGVAEPEMGWLGGAATDYQNTDANAQIISSSQATIPSTEEPGSPVGSSDVKPENTPEEDDRVNESFRTDANDDHEDIAVIPSSLTPPPSSQHPFVNLINNVAGSASAALVPSSQRSALFSPPPTTGIDASARRDAHLASDYVPPSPQQVLDASADELRAMMQSCITENSKLKTEAAHHKLQLNLVSLQAKEDAKRAAVEYDMNRREVEALRLAEDVRQARLELTAASESSQAKYMQLKVHFDEALDEIEALRHKLKLSKKLIQQKEFEIDKLQGDREQLRTRIRENREHFNMLRSPGGLLHGQATKQGAVRGTPKPAPIRTSHRDQGQEPLAALLQALNHDNNSAPSTPTSSHRPASRIPPRHTRNVQSLSSLPTTPTSRSRDKSHGLLPSVDLVPQTEPARRYGLPRFPSDLSSPVGRRERRSRESTISASDAPDVHSNAELARQALESAFLSRAASRRSAGDGGERGEDLDVTQSQASLTASEMLRQDPRESFDVASSGGSRGGTPTPGDGRDARPAAGSHLGLAGSGMEKRKASRTIEGRHQLPSSPPKRARVAGHLGDAARVGLGIQY